MRTIALIGGTGFIGRHLANRLTQQGWHVRVLTRRRERHRDLLVLPNLELVSADHYQQYYLNTELAGCQAIINLVGILNENGSDGSGFYQAHVELPKRLLHACQRNQITRFLHLSALNANPQEKNSHYLRTKGQGEDWIHSIEGMQVTTFRPSVVFGEDDNFINRFANLLKIAPFFFALPSAYAKMAPVWVEDLVEVMLKTLDDPNHYGERYSLCGPQVYTLQEIVEYTAKVMGLKRYIIPLKNNLSHLTGNFMELIPGKPYSVDNYQTSRVDSICQHNHFAQFNSVPHSLESILPTYLNSSTQRSMFYSHLRCQARR